MNVRTESGSFKADIGVALLIMVAAMYFLPFLRKLLLLPAAGLLTVLAIMVAIALFRRKPPQVTFNFAPPIAAPAAPGATEMTRKALADKISNLDWLPFEQLVTGLYSTLGYLSKRFGGPYADSGVDLLLVKNKTRTLVRCLHWKVSEVEDKDVKEFLGTLTSERLESGILVTAREISFGARRTAAMNDLVIVGTKDLVRMLEGADWEKNGALQNALKQSRKFCPRCQKDMVLKNATTGPNPGSRIWSCSGQPVCGYTVNA